MQGEGLGNVSVRELRERFERLAQAANANSGRPRPRVPPPVLRQIPAAAPPPNVAAAPIADAVDLRRLAPNRPALVAGVINMPPLMNGGGNRPPFGGGHQPFQQPAAAGGSPLAGGGNRPPAAGGNRPL